MKIFLSLALALAFLLPEAPVQAAQTELNRVIQALEAPFRPGAGKSSGIAGFRADFTQESRIASLDRLQHGSGEVAVKFERVSPDRPPLTKFRWDYTQPTEQVIVSNGRTMWVYVPENRQVIESEIDLTAADRPEDPMTFLSGLGNLSRDFQITWASPGRDSEGNYVLELRPRKPSPMLEHLLVTIDPQAVSAAGAPGKTRAVFPIRSTTVYDPSGNSTHIAFSHVRVNVDLPDRLFQFTIPAGIEVLHPNSTAPGS